MQPAPRGRTRRALSSPLAFALLLSLNSYCGEATPKPKEAALAPPPKLLPPTFTSLLKNDPALVEYWSLNGDTLGAQKKLALKTARPEGVFQPGPFDDCRSIELLAGQGIHTDPSPALDAPQIAFEMTFMAPGTPKRESGEGCLIGIRNGKEARFSVHYKTGSYFLSLWNGKESVLYESDFCLQLNRWYHLAVSISDSSATIWLNGKRCRADVERGVGKDAKNLPLVVGANDVAGTGEPAGIRVCQLALYGKPLNDSSVGGRIKALGWPDPVPLNEAQLVDKRLGEFVKEYQLGIHWKFRPEFIPAQYKNQMKAAQASVQQANMMIGLYERMCKAWPKEVTRHIRGIYVCDWIEMMGVRGVCMAEGRCVYMSSNLPEYVLWPRCFHECSHVVSEVVPLDRERWNTEMAKDARYLGWDAAKGNPFETSERLYGMGFLFKYSQINQDEEFAILSDSLFSRPKELKELMAKYPEVRKRATLTIEYFKKISKEFDFSLFDDVLATQAPKPREPAKTGK